MNPRAQRERKTMEAMRRQLMEDPRRKDLTGWHNQTRSSDTPNLRTTSRLADQLRDTQQHSTPMPRAPSSTDTQYSSTSTVNSPVTAKGWKLEGLLQKGTDFVNIRRVSMEHPEMVQKAIDEHEREGVPLVIQDWHKHAQWAKQIFGADWLLEKYGNNRVSVRNCHDRNDENISLREFITTSRATDPFTQSEESERLYAKDAECPQEWRSWLLTSKVLPDDLLPKGTDDLLQYLPQEEAVESLLCYYGIGDTLTPCHKDLCGSSGHNIMCYAEKGGSSFWFMTASNVAPDVAQYFQKEFGEELDWETHVTTVEEFANAPFNVYITEQRLGDLVLVPPRSCHQVVNHGGLTMKMSWSRMTFKGLRTALHYELPIYRRVCRPEQYRVKAVLYHSLLHFTAEPQPSLSTSIAASISNRMESLKCLLGLFDELLCEEFVSMRGRKINVLGENRPGLLLRPPFFSQNGKGQKVEQSRNVACDFCGADIFQSFFECQSCLSQGTEKADRYGDGLLICAPCYIEGRSCRCGVMIPVQCRPFVELLQDRNKAANALKQLIEGEVRSTTTIVAELTESSLTDVDHIRVFEAACVLCELRENFRDKLNETRKCQFVRDCRTMSSHEVPYLSAVHCDPCRDTICFEHLLQQGVHSAEVFPLIDMSGDHNEQLWHQRYKDNAATFERTRSLVEEAEKAAKSSSLRDRLVVMARCYRQCKPIEENLVMRGWYDAPDYEVQHPGSDTEGQAHVIDVVTGQYDLSIAMDEQVLRDSWDDARRSPLTEMESDDDVEMQTSQDAKSTSSPTRLVAGKVASALPPDTTIHSMHSRIEARKERPKPYVLIPTLPSEYLRLKRVLPPESDPRPTKRTKKGADRKVGIPETGSNAHVAKGNPPRQESNLKPTSSSVHERAPQVNQRIFSRVQISPSIASPASSEANRQPEASGSSRRMPSSHSFGSSLMAPTTPVTADCSVKNSILLRRPAGRPPGIPDNEVQSQSFKTGVQRSVTKYSSRSPVTVAAHSEEDMKAKERLEKRVTVLEAQLTSYKKSLEVYDGQLKRYDERSKSTVDRLARYDEQSKSTNERLKRQDEQLKSINERFGCMQGQMKLSAEQLSSIKEQLDSTTSRLERLEKQYQEAAASELESRKSQSEPESHHKRIQELEETINRWHQLEKLEQNISLLRSQFTARLPVDASSPSNFAREANSTHGTLKMAPLDGSNIASDSLATIRSALQESFNELIVPILRRVVQNESTEHLRADPTLTAHGIPFPPTERDIAPRASVEQPLWSKQGMQQDCNRSNEHIHTRNIPSYAYTAQRSRSGQGNQPDLHENNQCTYPQSFPGRTGQTREQFQVPRGYWLNENRPTTDSRQQGDRTRKPQRAFRNYKQLNNHPYNGPQLNNRSQPQNGHRTGSRYDDMGAVVNRHSPQRAYANAQPPQEQWPHDVTARREVTNAADYYSDHARTPPRQIAHASNGAEPEEYSQNLYQQGTERPVHAPASSDGMRGATPYDDMNEAT